MVGGIINNHMKIKKENKLTVLILTVGVVLNTFTSCGSGKDKSTLLAERDSLREVNKKQTLVVDGLNATLDEISLMIDSIAIHEGRLFLANNTSDEVTSSRDVIRNNIRQFELMLNRQKDRVKELETKLKESGANSSRLEKVIRQMKKQIEQKGNEIAELRSQLDDSRRSIEELRGHVTRLNTQVSNLNQKNAEQDEALSRQDQILNEGYYLVASKKQLKARGIVTGGNLFKKSKANLSNISTDGFMPVDIRNFQTLNINAKKAKLLSPAPADSYTLEKDGNGWKLVINDASAFWSVSNFLVIQTD